MKTIQLIGIGIFLLSSSLYAQDVIEGTVREYIEEKDDVRDLPGAHVYWRDTLLGVFTDHHGHFHLERPSGMNHLVVSFTGYQPDTIQLKPNQRNLDVVLLQGSILDDVVIRKRFGGSYISRINTIQTEVITLTGLTSLACCNLAESFENSATVDVNFTDAVSGARQIRMLGLAGTYTQLMFENMPALRGLVSIYGLNYVPGTWMESIQVSKGTSSVVNGYEAITGQINVELRKPEHAERFYLNLFQNNEGRSEANVHTAIPVSKRWSTAVLAHGSRLGMTIDQNEDGFVDIPHSEQLNFLNRWTYEGRKMESQFGVQYLTEDRQGGQTARFNGGGESLNPLYRMNIDSRFFRAFAKTGFVLNRNASSIGFQASYSGYERASLFGMKQYSGESGNTYFNMIYQSYIFNTSHKYSVGASYQQDDYKESFNDTVFRRNERVPGVFLEYNYHLHEKMHLAAGLRYDENSQYGSLFTPRVHLRYNLDHHLTLRGSIGRGYRTPNVFSDYPVLMASSRKFFFADHFAIESAWTSGLGVYYEFHLPGDRDADLSVDFYHTVFENQVVMDMDRSVREVHFYNLDGQSYSNSVQVDLGMELFQGLSLRTGWRYNDVKATYNGVLRDVPFVNKYKGVATLSWQTAKERWKFDLTNQFNGYSRIPSTADNPLPYRRADQSPDYYILHAQVTRRLKNIDLYIGGENLTNFVQKNPVIASDAPLGEYFDASMIWGPVLGRMIYAGLRFQIE